MWEPSQRYPDPAVQVLDASFNQYRLPLASVEQLANRLPLVGRPGVCSATAATCCGATSPTIAS